MMGLKERAFARDPSRCPWRSWFPRTIFTGICKRYWISHLSMIWCAGALRLRDDHPLIQSCSLSCNW